LELQNLRRSSDEKSMAPISNFQALGEYRSRANSIDVNDVSDFARHEVVEESAALVACSGAEISEVIHCEHS
jgi:hypothetical protein